MPFESEAQRKKFHADPKLRHLASEFEAHTPKGKKLRKKAFMEGFYETLVKAAAGYPSTARTLDLKDFKSTSGLIMKIIHDPSISKADKNQLIARLEGRGTQAIASPQVLAGPQISPIERILYNSAIGQALPPSVSSTLKTLLNLGMLSRKLNLPPVFGTQARIIDRRRKPEEEWRSPWKTTPI